MHEQNKIEKTIPTDRENRIFYDLIAKEVSADTVILDAGSGSGKLEHDFTDRGKSIVGLDVDPYITGNPFNTYDVVGNIYSLPFKSETFSVVFSRYVLEHLEFPQSAFSEFRRVLNNEGTIIIHTVNKRHPITLLSRMTPYWFHRYVNRKRGIESEDTFRTFYRANTVKRLAEFAEGNGFLVDYMETVELTPNETMKFSKVVFGFFSSYGKLVNRLNLSSIKLNIYLVLKTKEGR